MRLRTGIRFATVALATAMVAAGCGGDGDTSGGGGSDGPVALTFWTWAPGMEEIAAAWNQGHPDIQVTVNKQDGGDPAVTKLLTAIKAGSGAPDIMQAEYQKLPTLVASDALADLSETIDTGLADHYTDGIWNAVTLGGDAIYALPQDSGPMQFYYRADIFEQLGLQVPTTWDEYAQVAAQVKQADPSKWLGTFSAADAGWFTGLAQQAGASWWGIEGDAWKVDIDSDATKKVAEYWGGLVEQGVIDNKPMYTPEWNAGLNDGSQIGWLSAVWAPGVLAGNAPDTAGKWEMAPMPQWDASNPANGSWGGSATAVTSQSAHPEEAAEFITWMNSSQEGVNLLADSGLYPADVPGQDEALADPPSFMSNQADFYDVAGQTAEQVNNFTYGPNINVAFSAYNDQFAQAAEQKRQQAFVDAVTSMQDVTIQDLRNSGFSIAE